MEEISKKSIIALRMERQHLIRPADDREYDLLYRDTQPGQSVYWHGFGRPPVLSYRAAFDDVEYNRGRQLERQLVKGRFQGGNIGWIMAEEMELFCCLYRKPMEKFSFIQEKIWELICQTGPVTIQQIKEETGLLVKEITPVLHRLQEAFLVYEDQYDGDWERGWYRFEEIFPDLDMQRYSKQEALSIALRRYAYRMVYFTEEMAKNFYKVTKKDLKAALEELVDNQYLMPYEAGYIIREDAEKLKEQSEQILDMLYLMHRNDILVKSYESDLKKRYKSEGSEVLYYVLINGEFHGAVTGKYTYGIDPVGEIIVDQGYEAYVERIIEAIHQTSTCRESAAEKVSVRRVE